jgi:hypothetical protein
MPLCIGTVGNYYNLKIFRLSAEKYVVKDSRRILGIFWYFEIVS